MTGTSWKSPAVKGFPGKTLGECVLLYTGNSTSIDILCERVYG